MQLDTPQEPAMSNIDYQYVFSGAAYHEVNQKQGYMPKVALFGQHIKQRLQETYGDLVTLPSISYSPTNWAIHCNDEFFQTFPGINYISILTSKTRAIHQCGIFCINKNQVLTSAFLIWWARDFYGNIINLNNMQLYMEDCHRFFVGVSGISNVQLDDQPDMLNQAEATVFQCLTNQHINIDKPHYNRVKQAPFLESEHQDKHLPRLL